MKREELFSKALKSETEKLMGSLLCSTDDLIWRVWEKIYKELKVSINSQEFYERVMEEAKQRQWDLYYFRNSKNEPVTNLFKKLIREVSKGEGINLTNDALSRILNVVRQQYSDEAELSAGLYPAEAFFKREKYGIPDDLGDTNSCFRSGGCNEGSAFWLVKENQLYKRAWFVVFHYKSGSKEGYGRCWAFHLPNAVYATNFYSYKFEIKEERFKYVVVRLIRMLFDLSENVKFATGKNAPLPIYLNGDGIVIYEPSHWESSAHVLDEMMYLESRCSWCQDKVKIYDLRKYDKPIYYSPAERRVDGLIVCPNCSYELDDMVECYDCGEWVSGNDARYIDGVGYICDACFENDWFYCDRCGEPHRREYAIFTPDERLLCDYCASRLGAICGYCGKFVYFDKEDDEVGIEEYTINRGNWETELYICDKCAEAHLKTYRCEECGSEIRFLDSDFRAEGRLRDMVRLGLCLECYCKRRREVFEDAFENRMHPSLFTFSTDSGERVLREILLSED